jgi:hypothetical protein
MVKLNVMPALCSKPPPHWPSEDGQIDAGAATDHHPAGMTLAEAPETTRLHRVAGLTGDRTAAVTTRPCRTPHHTIADVGLIGGGQVPTPGDVSLAPQGVRCLDELPACRRISGHRASKGANLAKMGSTADRFTRVCGV